MAARDEDAARLSGKAPGDVGLLLVDVINPLDFPGAERLEPAALKQVDVIVGLRSQADAQGVPVIYVNDNYGHWASEKSQLVDEIRRASPAAGRLVERLAPRASDYFVIKPQVSGFYATNLPVLLPKLGVSRLVLAGFATDICVLFTAADAHMREYGLWTPRDAMASESADRHAWALELMAESMQAETRPTTELSLSDWVGQGTEAASTSRRSNVRTQDGV